MHWNRSNTIGLAKVSCSACHGYGLRLIRHGKEVPCECVFRTVFRTCYRRFRECVVNGEHTSTVTLDFCRGLEVRRTYSRKREEYMADFCLVSRRLLNDVEHQVFRFHFLLGADWKLCCRRLHLNRGYFFHLVYRIQNKLGKGFAELEPYALFPLDEYFSGLIRREPQWVRPASSPVRSLPLSA